MNHPHNILATIADKTRQRIATMKEKRSLAQLARIVAQTPHQARALNSTFSAEGINIIAEVKYASPSQGRFAAASSPTQIASAYLAAGAKAISVLTEPFYFHGHLDYLRDIRAAHPEACLLMKDFVVDPYQLLLAKEAGADAVLLIMAMLEPSLNKDLLQEARAMGLSVLVETHDAAEITQALTIGADIIGVNSRNLRNLHVDLDTARTLAAQLPTGVCAIAESGIGSLDTCHSLRALGYHGFLMGTRFMRHEDPGTAFQHFMAEGTSP